MEKYEIKLDPREQRMALVDLAKALQANIKVVERKRTWRASEKAMTIAETKRRQIAVLMAIDRLDAS